MPKTSLQNRFPLQHVQPTANKNKRTYGCSGHSTFGPYSQIIQEQSGTKNKPKKTAIQKRKFQSISIPKNLFYCFHKQINSSMTSNQNDIKI